MRKKQGEALGVAGAAIKKASQALNMHSFWLLLSLCSRCCRCYGTHLHKDGAMQTICQELRIALEKAKQLLPFKTFFCFRSLSREVYGQATLEAALMLPTLLLLFTILLQPLCLFYTQSVMESAAAEGLRALTSSTNSEASSLDAVKRYIIRRLAGVPEIALFHVGGQNDWLVELEGSQTDKHSRVLIMGHARALPLVGAPLMAVLSHDDAGIVLSVEVQSEVRPAWLEGDYASWQSVWG